MLKEKWNPCVPVILCALTWMVAWVQPLGALTVQQGPDGYIVQLTNGESVAEAWRAIRSERVQTNAPEGVRDIIELGSGVFPLLTSQYSDPVLHYWSGSVDPFPPLVIRGTGAATSFVLCATPRLEEACVVSLHGLVFEDIGFLVTNSRAQPIMRITNADLTLRRVKMVGQSIALPSFNGAFDVFNGNLTIEDSVLSSNQVAGGKGLLQFHGNNLAFVARISRSTLAGNTAPAVVKIFSYDGSRIEVEQSTLVENVGVVFQGSGNENVTISRSILGGNLSAMVQLTVADSFTDADPQLVDDGFGSRVPRPASPVIDALSCSAPGLDQRGQPTGVQAAYLASQGTDCDYGAIEAQHHFCMATHHGTVACDEGEIDVTEVTTLGCRLIGGLLDCTGGEEAAVTFLDQGESLLVGSAELLMQADGNLVLYNDGVARWDTRTSQGPCIGHYAEVQLDGNLVVFSDPLAAGGALPCFATAVPAEKVVVRQGFRGAPAQLVAERADGSVAWITTHNTIASGQRFTLHGSHFRPGDALTIPGASALMQHDGNFVLYDTIDGVQTVIWATGTEGACAGQDAVFQGDGNLVISAPGTTCLGAIDPPSGGTVLRLHRTPLGVAALTLYDARGEVLWSVPEPPTGPAHCGDLPVDSPDGIYTMVDRIGASRQVYCDMSGGGWMLVGKVLRSHNGESGLSEPANWWTAGTGQVDALVPGTVDWTAGSDMVAYGAAWLADLDLDVARFDLIAELADPFTRISDATPGQTASWYKGASTLATWFSAADTVATAVCSDEALACTETGRIVATPDGTYFEGMQLPAGVGWLHTRPDSDNRAAFDGVCSHTFNDPSWLDSAAEHWGNGLDVWVKKRPNRARCSDFPAGFPDGVYTVVDGAGVERQIYCDMSGGGWMLVGKVLRSHAGASGLSEPADWWTAGTGQVDALVPGTVDWTAGPDVAAYGAAWLADLGLDVARFDLIAELADPFTRISDATPSQTASWYKDASTIATWFSVADTVPSAVCSSEALSCSEVGRIMETNDGTWFEGMRLPTGSGWIHTRPDGDSRAAFDGMCSYTFNDPSWLDSAAEHWGNGLDVWVK